MNFASKTVLAATALTLGLAAAPASAQVLGYNGGYDRSFGYADRTASGIDDTGRLNVFGARIDPRRVNGGVLGGGNPVGGVIGGVGNAVGGVVGGVGTAVGGVVGGVGNAVGGVVGGVGNAVGGTVGGVTGAADDIVTGSIGTRDGRYTAAQERRAQRYDRQAARASRPGKYEHPFTPTVRN